MAELQNPPKGDLEMSLQFCSWCNITFSGVNLDCPLCEANAKINDVLKENEVLRERLDSAACGLCGGKDKCQ